MKWTPISLTKIFQMVINIFKPNKANSRAQQNPNRWDSTGKVDET